MNSLSVIASVAKQSSLRPFRTIAGWIAASASPPRNDGGSQSGNAILFVLLAIVLFGALMFTFMRGSQTGQGNLTKHQAQMKAQELAAFLSSVDRGFQKLVRKGCSENDISFEYPGTLGSNIDNHPTSAPSDFSCHIFRAEGAGLSYSISPQDYQLSYETIAAINASQVIQHDNFRFRSPGTSNVGLGTAADDLMLHFNFIIPSICKAYNDLLGFTFDYTISDTGPVAGDENPEYANKTTFCRYYEASPQGQIRYVWSVH